MLVRYYGHVGQESGYGEAAAETCMAILSAGLDLEISTTADACHRRFLPLARCFRDESALSTPDVVIVHTLPMGCGTVLKRADLRARYPNALLVAYTTWEGACKIPPAMVQALSGFDQVWVPSHETATWMVIPDVYCVPHACDEDRAAMLGRSNDLARSVMSGGSRPYMFYYVGAWTGRKNVEGVIRAYTRAFVQTDSVELLILSAGAPPSACQVAMIQTGLRPDETPPVSFIYDRITDEAIVSLHRGADCFVTATRGESWNLPAFDALLAGRHIISPGGLGSDAFLGETSADLYGSHAVPASWDVRLVNHDGEEMPDGVRAQPRGIDGLSVRNEWREPDLMALALRMVSAYKDRPVLRVSYDPVARFGRRAVGQLIARILQGAKK